MSKVNTERQCICCEKSIVPVDMVKVKKKSDPVREIMWAGGTVERLYCGYGSTLDGNSFIVAVCDKCLRKKKRVGIAEQEKDFY